LVDTVPSVKPTDSAAPSAAVPSAVAAVTINMAAFGVRPPRLESVKSWVPVEVLAAACAMPMETPTD
jgi:Ca2+-dependent lipid-binding protein